MLLFVIHRKGDEWRRRRREGEMLLLVIYGKGVSGGGGGGGMLLLVIHGKGVRVERRRGKGVEGRRSHTLPSLHPESHIDRL